MRELATRAGGSSPPEPQPLPVRPNRAVQTGRGRRGRAERRAVARAADGDSPYAPGTRRHFVPDHRIEGFGDMVERRYASSFTTREPNSAMAFIPVAALILAAPLLGLARHALEITLANVPGKNVAYTAYRQARMSPSHQIDLAESATEFDLAELLMQRAARDVDEPAAAGVIPDRLLRGRVRHRRRQRAQPRVARRGGRRPPRARHARDRQGGLRAAAARGRRASDDRRLTLRRTPPPATSHRWRPPP